MKAWDGVAYDALPLPHEQWGKRTIEALKLQPTETLLDAGCGTGRDAQLALEQLPNGFLVCVDQSSTMLDQCRTRFGDDSRVQILEGDLDHVLPVEPARLRIKNAQSYFVGGHGGSLRSKDGLPIVTRTVTPLLRRMRTQRFTQLRETP